ncbi:MAG TPA: hypothetical protein VES88_03015 [Gemmatimonadaceae bacterium]|nr:hypothetical protein [Gemmatimonadaceae bacterium]
MVEPVPDRRRLTAALGDCYAVEAEIGSGGMAIVYRAIDRKHDRPVALIEELKARWPVQ